MYQKSDVISTSTGSLKEGTVVSLFEANEKYTQVVMGLDENCVMVSKSSFLDSSRQFFQNIEYPTNNIELGEFISLNDSQSSIINSISLVYRQQTFDNIDQIKHKLALLVSALQTKEKHNRYLSKQVALIIEEKNQFKRVIKEKCLIYLKENNAVYEEFKIKMIYKEVQAEAQNIVRKIQVFQLLEKIYAGWDRKELFRSDAGEEYFLASFSNMNLRIPGAGETREVVKLIENKTIVNIPLKTTSGTSILSSYQRADYIQKLLLNTTKPLKNLVSNQLQISPESVYHTVHFLMKNQLAVSVFPFDPQRYYSLYTLRSMPDKKVIQKFNSIFKDEDIMEYLKKFQKYYRVRYLDEKIKYLLLNKIIKEVTIYIEKLEPVSSKNNGKEQYRDYKAAFNHQLVGKGAEKTEKTATGGSSRETPLTPQSQSTMFIKKNDVESILNQYVTKPEEINVILDRCREKGIKMSELINFVKHNSNYWKFIFVQKNQ